MQREDLLAEHTEEDEDDNNNSVLMEAEEQVEEVPLSSTITLRPERIKKRRSSFIYTSVKKRSRKYCVCNKGNDGRKYWQCEGCDEWFHPGCLGLEETEEPNHFYCRKECEVKTGERVCGEEFVSRDEEHDESYKKINAVSDVHGDRTIDYAFISGKLEEVKSFICDILSCNNKDCDEYSHQRHHQFTEHSVDYLRQNRRKHLYGMDYFECTTIEKLHETLIEELILQMRHPQFPVTGLQISMLRNLPKETNLFNLLAKEKILAGSYITHVLMKEVQAFLVPLRTGMPLQCTDQQCLASEIDAVEFIKRNKKRN